MDIDKVKIMPTTLTVTHVSTMYIVNPTDDAGNLHSQRIDRPLTNDAGQIGNSRKMQESLFGILMPILFRFSAHTYLTLYSNELNHI